MNPQIERLQALVAQLIARLEHERSESRRLTSHLVVRYLSVVFINAVQ